MKKPLDLSLDQLDRLFPDDFTDDQLACAKTEFLKELSLRAHRFYTGKIMTMPKAGLFGFNWFNVWYTPGVSKVSTTIRDDNDASFDLSNRGNTVAVVSDSTRVLGDGDCTPPGGLGVMEGKAYLMKYLGGIDAAALCINSRDDKNNPNPDKIIDFVKMLEPSVGAVNLEDISQPNCYHVLDTLREECDIPVWHDDAQGTACVTLAGLINALKIRGTAIQDARVVLLGAGASNTTIARLILRAGGNPERMALFDSKGGLHTGRGDIQADAAFYRKWELCRQTNPKKINNIEEALKGADVLIALSKPGPDTVKPEWVRSMADRAIVFVCANPVPEIWPAVAREAGAYIVATGRGDFPNQVNNSLCFPGLLKGALLVRARKVTDNMAITAARSLANYAEKKGLSPDCIIPKMDDPKVFAQEAADVAVQAAADGVVRVKRTWQEVYDLTLEGIRETRKSIDLLTENGQIQSPDSSLLEGALEAAIRSVTGS